jgi:tetratricopeptide (TPR) repeat protein
VIPFQAIEPASADDPVSPRARWLAAAGLAVVAAIAFHNSFSVPFLFDDIVSIVENPALQHLSPALLWGSEGAGGLTTSGRPLVALSLALNHAFSGSSVWSYHAVNLAIHVGAGLCLFGLVRRTLSTPVLRARFGPASFPLAWLTAAIWLAHPLHTESVTYIVQRAESLSGALALLTLYAFVRGAEGTARKLWFGIAVVACVAAMASKESVAATPLLVLLFDRTFVSGSFADAWRRHRSVHLALFASWILLLLLVLGAGGRGGTAGFSAPISAWDYALTQCVAILRYVLLGVWPQSLSFDYGLITYSSLTEVLGPAIILVAVVIFTVRAVWRAPVVAFAGMWFFAYLAPSSSIVPVATQTIAEHRVYLASAAIVAWCVCALYRLIGRPGMVVALATAVAFAIGTSARNQSYQTDRLIWEDTVRKRPGNARAHNNLGQALFREGDVQASIRCYQRALELRPGYADSHYNLGVAYAALDDMARAIAHYETALRLQPAYPEAENNLGNALVRSGRGEEAIAHFERALALNPKFPAAHNNLGNALLQLGRVEAAMGSFRRAIELEPADAEARYHLGNAFAAAGELKLALAEYEAALRLRPNYAEAHVNAGNALLGLDRAREALAHYRAATAANPHLADAHFNLGSLLLDAAQWSEAVQSFEAALRADPTFVRARRPLGFALAKLGRNADAIAHYEAYLAAVANDSDARQELAALRRLTR